MAGWTDVTLEPVASADHFLAGHTEVVATPRRRVADQPHSLPLRATSVTKVAVEESQLRKGALDLAVLALLARGESYGYELTQALVGAGFDGLGDATIYGTMRRMEQHGLVTSRLEPSPDGPAPQVLRTHGGRQAPTRTRSRAMAGTGRVDEHPAGPTMTTSPAPGVVQYVAEVTRRLRDLPRDERNSIEADLVQHVREAGGGTYHECVERFGTADRYAAGVREGLGLTPYRRSRRPLVVAALMVVLVAVAIAAWRAGRPESLPDDFQAVSGPMMSAVEGDATDAYGSGVQLVVDGGGTARFTMVVRNDSDETLDVTSLGVSFTLWRPNGSSVFGGDADVTVRPGEVVISQIWSPDVRIAPVDDPNTVSIDAHGRTGAPFAPFRWEPGDAYMVSLAGDVSAPCEPGWAWLDGDGSSIQIEYDTRDRGFAVAIAPIGIDASACT